MHAQSIIGVCSVALFIPAIVCCIVGGGGRHGPPKRPRWAVAGGVLLGLSLLQFGIVNEFFIVSSPRHEVVGFIGDLRQQGGKSASSTFEVLSDAGWSPNIHTRYNGPKIVEGDMVRVQYLEYDDAVVELTLLSGMHQGWMLKENDDTWMNFCIVMGGCLAFWEAQHLWRRRR